MVKSVFKKLPIVEGLLVIFLLFTFHLNQLLNLCKIYTSRGFDNQMLFMWEYSSFSNLLPYKDVFYPYGFLQYFKQSNLYLEFLSISIVVGSYFTIFLVIKKVFKERLVHYSFFFMFFFLTFSYVGFDSFERYGPVAGLCCVYAYIFFKQKNHLFKTNFLIGFINGLLFTLFIDTGLYGSFLFFIFALLVLFLRGGQKKIFSQKSFRYYAFVAVGFFTGFIIGCIPLFFYLYNTQSTSEFLVSFSKVKEMFLYAKTPFLHSTKSIENIFTLGALFLTVFHISVKIISKKNTNTFEMYLQLVFVTLLILLEQKSIVRSIDGQLTFIGFLLYCFILSTFLKNGQFKKNSNLLKVVIIFLGGMIGMMSLFLKTKPIYYFYRDVSNSQICIQENKKNLYLNKSEYKNVIAYLRNTKDFNGEVFSYPSDPIFYVEFQQTLPYYFSIYDASSEESQLKLIQYIEESKINYVIYNTGIYSIQDGVPDYLRGALLHKYILTHFTPISLQGVFLILKNSQKEDFFRSSIIREQKGIRDYLLNVNLNKIPESEGIYKSNNILSQDIMVSGGTLDELNLFLRKNHITSNKKFLIVRSKISKPQDIQLFIKDDQNNITNVLFSGCSFNNACIINISRLPLFYKNRAIKEISVGKGFRGNIQLANVRRTTKLW